MQGRIFRLRTGPEMVCRIQSELGADTIFILCAPLVPAEMISPRASNLHIPISIGEAPYLIVMSQMIALPRKDLAQIVGDASHLRDEMIAAVDLLVSGF